MRPVSDSAVPFFWYGHDPLPTTPPTLARLVAGGTLAWPAAGLLAAAVGQGYSLAVVAGASRAGKSTLLAACIAHLPPLVEPVFLRGSWERFDRFNGGVPAANAAILVNEVSPHLPAYLWGSGVRSALTVAADAFAVHATAHAADAAAFAALLTGPEIGLAPGDVAAFDLVVTLGSARGRPAVTSITALVPGLPGELRLVTVCGGDADLDAVERGLDRVGAQGWGSGSDRLQVDRPAIKGALGRLDRAFDMRPPSERPGAMLVQRRPAASPGGGAAP